MLSGKNGYWYLNKYPDLTRCGYVFGRVAMGIRVGGIDEGADATS
jgi:hypothetical protein